MSHFETILEKFWVFSKGIFSSSFWGVGILFEGRKGLNKMSFSSASILKQYMYYKRARILLSTRKFIYLQQMLNIINTKIKISIFRLDNSYFLSSVLKITITIFIVIFGAIKSKIFQHFILKRITWVIHKVTKWYMK